MTDREAFEAWACEEATRAGYRDTYWVAHRNGLGEYATIWVEGAWKGWQAAAAHEREKCIQDIECEHVGGSPSDDCDNSEDRAYNQALRDSIDAIRARTKP